MAQALIGLCTILFLGAFFLFDRNLIFATEVLLYSSLISTIILALFYRKKTKGAQWTILITSIIFGAMTVYFESDDFIKWRTSIVNGGIAALLFALYYFKKSPLKMLFAPVLEIELPDEEWLKTNIMWGIYMVVMALLNAGIIILQLSDETWMLFKTIINPAITFGLSLLLLYYLHKRSQIYSAKKGGKGMANPLVNEGGKCMEIEENKDEK